MGSHPYRICTIPGEVGSGGLFYKTLDSFSNFAPLQSVCLQVIVLSLLPHFIHMVLISTGRPVGITYFLFAKDGFQVVDMLAHFSSMFFIFKVGVQMDPKILKRAKWRTYIIGFCCILCSYVAGESLAHRVKNDDIPGLRSPSRKGGFNNSTKIVNLFGMISFPVITYILTDLNILNSDLGSLATHVAMVADFLHTFEKFYTLLSHSLSSGNPTHGRIVVYLMLETLIYICLIVRPAALWIVKNTPEGRPVNDACVSLIMISVLLCGLASEYIGLNGTVGAFFLGLAIPDGPPLGSALVHKIRIVTVFFMPLHMGIVGYKTDIHKVHFSYLWRVLLVIFGCFLGKIIGLFIPAVLLGVSARDSLLLGLIMNFKGIVEVSTLSTWLDAKRQNETFGAANTIMVLTLVVQVAVITPTVKYLYDPSSKYLAYKGRSIMQSHEVNSDFRVLVCVHTQDDVPGIIKLLEASNPTKLHPLTVYILHLLELVGRATPLLISHPLHTRVSTSNPTKSEIIINVFQQFQNRHQHLVTVHPFSTISPYASMHNDICTMSVDKRTALIIFPFCRQDVVSKRDDLERPTISNRSMKALLQNLLRNSPCSVGILIDGSKALAFVMNMIHHPSVLVTLVRYFGPASLSSDEKFLDEELVDHFRVNTMHKETLMYKEVEVKDGAEAIWSVRSLREDFDLMLVGRQQISDSKIVSELNTNWAECEELGAVGDMVTSPDYDAEGSILIIHQRLVVS
ncbi:hypothetical protein MKW98_029058 [Papaver atlanticum]|uniref:Cation/H+ exchanger domain-containing protein n=1 Tax=Papaver atlanticum TaxID=357466 RepID=A0AAD4X608_9MAGN|nr:hypothetical protein MKW98_029058 [Papaver atlanticum]